MDFFDTTNTDTEVSSLTEIHFPEESEAVETNMMDDFQVFHFHLRSNFVSFTLLYSF